MKATPLLAVVVALGFVAAGCGSTSRRPTPEYTLRQIKAAFAAQGITLRKMLGHRRLVVLVDSQWSGPFGYQRAGHGDSSVTQFLVFVRDGPHTTQRGTVSVAYGDGEGQTVKAALRQLARHSKE